MWLAVFFSMFLHASILHVLGNMLFLWIFGNNVEDQLGPVWFLVLYLVGGIVASLVHIAGNLDSAAPFLGASGAIAVVMGAYLVWFPRARVLTLVPIVFIFCRSTCRPSSCSASGSCCSSSRSRRAASRTLAHIGGFVFGMLVAFVLARAAGFPQRRPPPPRRRATAARGPAANALRELRRERAEVGGDERRAPDREPAPRPRVPAMPESTSANGTPSAVGERAVGRRPVADHHDRVAVARAHERGHRRLGLARDLGPAPAAVATAATSEPAPGSRPSAPG